VQIVNAADFESKNQNSMDDTLLVKFFLKAREDREETKAEGRPIFKDVEYVEIRIPGSRDAVARPAGRGDIARFPKHYEAFKNRTEMPESGTPLIEWPLMTRSHAEELSFFNVKTVEQLVAMSDQNASQFMGINKLKAKAKEWLEMAKEQQSSNELASELAKRDDEIEELKAAVRALQAAPTKKKATRKKRASKKATAKKE
jgi:hypothetical protein